MAKGGKAGQAAVWVLLALLILGLGGFGITSFGGSVRKIGTVDGQEISTNDYFRALRQEMDALSRQAGRNVDFTQGLALGVDRAVRQSLVTMAALDAETARIGMSVGDARLAREIREMAAFQNLSGTFDRATYGIMLDENGFTEAEFEARIREELARGLLQAAVATGYAGSEAAGRAFHEFLEERRSFSLLRLTEADLPGPLAEPDEAALRAYHAANAVTYTRPESRQITYAALLPEMVASETPVDEAELRALYQSRIAEFVQPERRLVERLVFPDDASAQEARNRLDAGLTTFEALVADRGLDLADVDLGDVAPVDLGAAAQTVFEMTEPGVVGPLPSSLGPALFRMNAVLDALEIPFEDAREQLQAEAAMDAARRTISDRIDEVDDLLAGGAALEDLGKELGMRVETIVLEPGQSDGIAAYPAFRTEAARVNAEDFPTAFRLDDGGIAAVRLDEVLAPALRPFEDISDRVAEDARASALRTALQAEVDRIIAALNDGAALGNFGIVEVHSVMPRGGRVDAAPADLVDRVFAMDEGAVASLSEGSFVGIVKLDTVLKPDPEGAEAAAIARLVSQQMAEGIGRDAYALFSAALEERASITMDEGAIAAVHAQMR